jgi:hypothetical protein
MKFLLDECIDRKLAKEFVGYEVKTVPQMGWTGVKNGQLLALAEAEFDVFRSAIALTRPISGCQNLELGINGFLQSASLASLGGALTDAYLFTQP